MGKIIRNGIKYSGTTDSANKINYDNSLSGLEAKTAQEAIDELSDSLNTLLLIKNVNSNSISLSSNTSNSFTFQIEKIEGYKPIIAFYASNSGGGSVVIPTRASELLDDTMSTFTLGARNIGTNNQDSVRLIANILYQRIN